MKAYQYNKHTGEYIGEIICQLDQLESKSKKKDIYLIPASSTDIEPPNVSDGQIAIFINNKWQIKKDNRGIYYHTETGEQVIIKEIDEDISDYTILEPTSIYDKWDGKKWVVDNSARIESEELVYIENKIQAKIRDMAIVELVKDGTLTQEEVDKIGG